MPLYARQGIREAWVVDVPAGTLEIYRDPRPDGYGSVEVVGREGLVSPLAFPDLTVSVGDLVP